MSKKLIVSFVVVFFVSCVASYFMKKPLVENLAASALAGQTQKKATIIASIKPVQLIIKALVGPDIAVDVLIPSSATPHFYQLRPSDIRKLEKADHLYWVGADMEVFLPQVIHSLEIKATAIMNKELVDSRSNTESAHGDHHEHDNHQHQTDPHVWIDPMYIIDTLPSLSAELITYFPDDASTIKKNRDTLVEALNTIIQNYRVPPSTEQPRRILTDHDAFQRLEKNFSIQISGSVSITPDTKPGAQHLAHLEHKIKELDKVCFLNESPTVNPYLKLIQGKADIKIVNIDLLAGEIAPTTNGYTDFLKNLLDKINTCQE